jgi:2-(1,2-epoxy-1,2-dihydrophenyl)acetyl-CoA isomerase
MTSLAQPVRLSIADGIAHIRFDRPGTLNAIDQAMAVALRDAVKEVLVHGGARVIVLSGEGRAFMAGGDLQAFHTNLSDAAITAGRIIDPLHEAVAALAEAPVPVIAAVQGGVAGAGMSLALGADFVLAADNTTFVPAYVGIGTSPDGGGTWALVRLVGLRRALEIALLGEPIDAASALQMGLVNRVVPRDELATATEELARRLAAGPTRALARTRRLLRDAPTTALRDHLRAERDAFAACARSLDFAEGVNAFFEKRRPRFQGR